MYKRIVKLFLVAVLAITLTGCTKYLKNDDNKYVTNELTGQRLTENILCQPENEDVIEIYKDNGYKLNKLPKCDKMHVTSGGYEGVWTTIFVKPLAWVIVEMGHAVKNYGLAIILITLIIRLLLIPLTQKSAMQSENMKLAQPDLTKLEKKYKDKKDQASQQQKAQEMMLIYKKYNINPLSGCLFALIQIPLFFAFYEALNRLPAVFEENFLSFQMGTSPYVGITNGSWQYVIIILLVILTTFLSFKLSSSATGNQDQQKQMKLMTNIMVIMISIAAFTISTGIAIYWIINSGFTVCQNLVVRRMKKNVKKK